MKSRLRDGGGRKGLTARRGPVLIAIALALSACDESPRPTKTEISLSDYQRMCEGGNRYETTCKGRFIVWDGAVQGVGDDYVRTKLSDDLTVDVQDVDPNEHTLVEGQRVRISGWLADENIIYPDVSKGAIQPLEAPDRATSRVAVEERASEAAVRRYSVNQVMRAEQNCSPPRSYASYNTDDFNRCVRSQGISDYPYVTYNDD